MTKKTTTETVTPEVVTDVAPEFASNVQVNTGTLADVVVDKMINDLRARSKELAAQNREHQEAIAQLRKKFTALVAGRITKKTTDRVETFRAAYQDFLRSGLGVTGAVVTADIETAVEGVQKPENADESILGLVNVIINGNVEGSRLRQTFAVEFTDGDMVSFASLRDGIQKEQEAFDDNISKIAEINTTLSRTSELQRMANASIGRVVLGSTDKGRKLLKSVEAGGDIQRLLS